ncbi:MAG: hypothetical protein H7061_04265 [Bdellovibrionaceae bacterium]|nr:hypothetical protein [Bdellovibrio sp.]
MKFIKLFFIFCLVWSTSVYGQTAKRKTSKATAAPVISVPLIEPSADELGAQAFLEEMLNRRYSQGLSTLVEKQSYNVSTQIRLGNFEDPDTAPAVDEKPSDLTLGYLDAEQLVKKFGMEKEKSQFASLLANKKVASILVNVGLSETLGATVKQDVEKWMQSKLRSEFGDKSKVEVAFIKMSTEKPKDALGESDTKPKNWWDWLRQFQQLAGIMLLAFSVIIGIMLWRFTTSKSSVHNQGAGTNSQFNLNSKSEMTGVAGGDGAKTKGSETLDETRKYLEEIFLYSQKINSVLPKVQSDIEVLLQTWCATGQEGFQKAVCFAEVLGKDVGRLPIPADALQDVAAIFGKMAEMPLKEKQMVVEKIYWDLITIINLGTDSLAQPFGYLSGIDPNLINQMLIEENSKMKTMVSIYAPDDLRQKMLAPLDNAQKLDILKNASELSEISTVELKKLNKSFQTKIKGSDNRDNIQLDTSLEKIISALPKIDELSLLPQIQGAGVQNYKRKNVSVAFLHEWPDDKLGLFITQLKTDHLVSYLRLKADQKERILAICQPRAAAVVKDEVEREDRVSLSDKENHLLDIAELMENFRESGNIDLETVFPAPAKIEKENSNVKPFKSA